MKWILHEAAWWKWCFLALLPCYAWWYGPYGVNETDGGFLTGLAWQLVQGKTLYTEVIYVRPPLPVWSRYLELLILPEHWQVLGERWIFYAKVWVYSYMAARILSPMHYWFWAAVGFVVSVHCYPPMAWHTVDGILWSVVAVYCLYGQPQGKWWTAVLGGVALVGALLCKQSFYPLLLACLVIVAWDPRLSSRQKIAFGVGCLAAAGAFGAYLLQQGLTVNYLAMTSGATTAGQALRHGILDYFYITPELALPSLLLVALLVVWWRKPHRSRAVLYLYAGWLLCLVFSYGLVTWFRQAHTVPFAQSRALFWIAAGTAFYPLWTKGFGTLNRPFVLLLAISWCAAISWGYSLPMLFATPWLWAIAIVGERLGANRLITAPSLKLFRVTVFTGLLAVFFAAYQFVYRDGHRSDMQRHLGDIFPKLHGIYSDDDTAVRYHELKRLAQAYGPTFAVLPAFPHANFLTNTHPPLPLDWVVNRETNGKNQLIYDCLSRTPYLFIEKSYGEKINTDPELEITRFVQARGRLVSETVHFWVIQLN